MKPLLPIQPLVGLEAFGQKLTQIGMLLLLIHILLHQIHSLLLLHELYHYISLLTMDGI